MRELGARLRARVVHLLGLASERDLPALEARLDSLADKFGRQTGLLERIEHRMAAKARELKQTRRLLGHRGQLTQIERNLHALLRRQFVDERTAALSAAHSGAALPRRLSERGRRHHPRID